MCFSWVTAIYFSIFRMQGTIGYVIGLNVKFQIDSHMENNTDCTIGWIYVISNTLDKTRFYLFILYKVEL